MGKAVIKRKQSFWERLKLVKPQARHERVIMARPKAVRAERLGNGQLEVTITIVIKEN